MIKLSTIAQYELLMKSWASVSSKKSKLKAKSSRGIDGISITDYSLNFKENLLLLCENLILDKYIPSSVKVSLQKKPNGKYRQISIPTIEDRIIQKALLTLIEPYIRQLINNGVSYCGVRDDENNSLNIKNAIQNAANHIKNNNFWIFESDIISFYDEIPKSNILSKLNSLVPMDSQVKKLIKQYIYYQIGNPSVFKDKENINIPKKTKGITQGSSLSPILANLYMADFDSIMKKRFGHRYLRYVDDFIVICNTKKEAELAQEISFEEIKKFKLKLSPLGKKTHLKYLKNDVVDFLGVSISRNSLSIKGGISKARGKIDGVFVLKDPTNGKDVYKNNLLRNGKKLSVTNQIEEKILSWGTHYRYYHVEDLYNKLDVYIENKAKCIRNIDTIMSLSKIKLSPIVTLDEWRNYFKNTN